MSSHDHPKTGHFGPDIAKKYDDNNRHLTPIVDGLHYLIRVVLSELPSNSKILCVGAGTGTEIIQLAEVFPGFSFVAVEPSASMIEVCKERLDSAGLSDRCELNQGYVHELQAAERFGAALCLFVFHHTATDSDDRSNIIAEVAKRLVPNGYFISAEISCDLASPDSDDIFEKWKALVRRSGAPEEKIQNLPKMFKEHLSILPPKTIEKLLIANGFRSPIQFFQSLLIRAWYCRRNGTTK